MDQIPTITELKNILILRGEGSLGDAILSSAGYREIKKANPTIKISVAAFGGAFGYLSKNPYIDKMYYIPARRVLRPNQRWLSLIWLGLKLHFKKFDLVLDSSMKDFYNWRLFKWLCGGETRVLDARNYAGVFGAQDQHASRHEQAVLELLGIQNPDPSYDLPIPVKTEQKINTFTAKNTPDGYVLLNPFGSVSARSLNQEIFAKVADFILHTCGKKIIIPCMPAQKIIIEKWLCEYFQPGVLVYQTADVFDLFALVRGALLVVTPDTAVVHITTGFARPMVAFYNSYWIYNAPNNPLAQIVKTDRNDVNKFVWEDFEKAVRSVNLL